MPLSCDVVRFVDGSVCACGATHIGMVKIPIRLSAFAVALPVAEFRSNRAGPADRAIGSVLLLQCVLTAPICFRYSTPHALQRRTRLRPSYRVLSGVSWWPDSNGFWHCPQSSAAPALPGAHGNAEVFAGDDTPHTCVGPQTWQTAMWTSMSSPGARDYSLTWRLTRPLVDRESIMHRESTWSPCRSSP